MTIPPDLLTRVYQHLVLTGAAVLGGVLLGLPLGIVSHRVPSLRGPVLWIAGILQTIPSLALLAMLLIATNSMGFLPAWIALTLYALLPIVRNTVTGLDGVPAGTVEAARGVGMTNAQRLIRVELPLALPVIVAGIRTAAIISVGIATLAAFIAAGGLGVYIFRGISLRNYNLIFAGAIPAAILALVVDGAIWSGEWASRPVRYLKPAWDRLLRPVAILPMLLLLLPLVVEGGSLLTRSRRPDVVIGSKEFSEQLLLGEMLAQTIEENTDLTVKREFGLGGTMICHAALVNGEIDMYPEYTGTGYLSVLNIESQGPLDASRVYKTVKEQYQNKFEVEWLAPYGFANTYALAVRQKDAGKYNWKCVSDLKGRAGNMTAGFTGEFMERADGYPGLSKTYGYKFGKAEDISPDLMYEALKQGDVDVIAAFSTDGRLEAYNLRVLQDDKNYWPPYDAATLVRQETLQKHPQLKPALDKLAGKIDVPTMQRLNYEVAGKQRPIKEVAREFLQAEGIVPGGE
ncbi:MAG: ABC transporter permease subunit [Phycisphaerae bacterium]|nr:ABC transporter permease subunit [Phycisphaerae bacterium]